VALGAAVLLAGCGGGASAPTRTLPDPFGSPPATVAPSQAGTVSDGPGPGPAATEDPVAAEDNPPGDIPDNLAFVMYRNSAGHYSFTHPEGWAEKVTGTTVVFTDKLNGVMVMVGTRTAAATVAQARQMDVPALARSQSAFELRSVKAIAVGSAAGVKIVYRRNSAPAEVTGRQYRDEVERYELVSGGRELIVELFGPVGADNVDAYRTMIDSLKFR